MLSDRYVPEMPFPAYAFVPGQHPHPSTDVQGHHFGQSPAVPTLLDPDNPITSREFLFAIDLFNAGFYWEAHETWEGLWIGAGRKGTLANFLKGLIKLAAAGVKSREGQPIGVQRHARRAEELFRSVSAVQLPQQMSFAGLVIDDLIQIAAALAVQPVVDVTKTITGRVVLPCRLTLVDG